MAQIEIPKLKKLSCPPSFLGANCRSTGRRSVVCSSPRRRRRLVLAEVPPSPSVAKGRGSSKSETDAAALPSSPPVGSLSGRRRLSAVGESSSSFLQFQFPKLEIFDEEGPTASTPLPRLCCAVGEGVEASSLSLRAHSFASRSWSSTEWRRLPSSEQRRTIATDDSSGSCIELSRHYLKKTWLLTEICRAAAVVPFLLNLEQPSVMAGSAVAVEAVLHLSSLFLARGNLW
ncbi:hypothetical protein SASPL_120806 [Salvia splendens]|uniref:Uncharacterized protein n=1 Tax=Salvia splendens TaxID=180675 RepID=A0A8X8ZVJ1_SALSN|nr:hypothetical protein SASPL_120806 [Salvia splendens]